MSHRSRGAWIEIEKEIINEFGADVASLTRCVD